MSSLDANFRSKRDITSTYAKSLYKIYFSSSLSYTEDEQCFKNFTVYYSRTWIEDERFNGVTKF